MNNNNKQKSNACLWIKTFKYIILPLKLTIFWQPNLYKYLALLLSTY